MANLATINNNLLADSGIDPLSVVLGTGTANQIAYWVDADNVGALTTATYPSLTELSYVKGVTSAIQTQLNAKLNLSGGTLTGALSGTSATFTLANNITLTARSGAAGSYTYWSLGRTSSELELGVAAAANQFFTGTAAGDVIIKANGSSNKLMLGYGSGSPTLTLASTGAATFSSSVTASSFVKSGGTAAQILAADGTVITAGTNITISGGSISAADIGFANPMTTLGDIIYGAASGTATRLAGNITTTKQYLSQTGTGTVSAAPSWSTIAGSDITGAALTETDDTNVTLTLGGTPSTALLRAVSLTLGWTGQLSVARGGTGAASYPAGQILYGNGTSAIASSATFTYTPTSALLVNNSVTAASAIARGVNITSTLVAAANNDALVGVRIAPTFTNGAFTGVTNTALSVVGNSNFKDNVSLEDSGSTNKWLLYHYTDNTLRFNYNGAGNDEFILDTSGGLRMIGFAVNQNPSSAGTSQTFIRYVNTGGDTYIGLESSVAGGFFGGSQAYDSVYWSGTAANFIIGGISRLRITTSGFLGINQSTPNNFIHITGNSGAVGATQITLEDNANGYGAGFNAASRTSAGGTLVQMGKVVFDGEGLWNTTASTQDAYYSVWVAQDGSLIQRQVIGSDGSVYFGNGFSSATPLIATLRGTSGTGTNVAGAEFRIVGGVGTGTGVGGAITFYTAAAGASGATLNTAAEKMRIAADGTVRMNQYTTNGIVYTSGANGTLNAAARTINGVTFNGSTNITITASTTAALTFNNGGAGAASGTTFDGGTARTISYNTIGAQPLLTNPITGDGTEAAGNISYFTGNTSIAGNASLFWDTTNSRLGVGTNTPNLSLDVRGNTTLGGGATATSLQHGLDGNARYLMVSGSGANANYGFVWVVNNVAETTGALMGGYAFGQLVSSKTGTNAGTKAAISGFTSGSGGTVGGFGGEMRFYTRPDNAANDIGSYERMRINSAGAITMYGALSGTSASFSSSSANQITLNGGTTVATRLLVARGSDDTAQNLLLGWNSITVQRTNVALSSAQTDFSIIQQGSDGSRTPFYISSGGNVFINNSAGVTLNGLTNKLSVSSTSYNLFDISRFSDNAFGPNFYLVKSRNASIVGNTIVANGDNLGNIVWLGANGTGFTDAASIRAEVDGTPGASNDMPGRLVFSTTADGSGTTTERMRITSGGNVGIGATNPTSAKLVVYGSAAAAANVTLLNLENGSDGGIKLNFSNSVAAELASITAAVAGTGAGTDEGNLVFTTSTNAVASEKMRITNNGTVQILSNTWIQTSTSSLIRESYFGYSSGYKVTQVGSNDGTHAVAIGVDLTGNASGNFGGSEIVIPNNKGIIAPNAANNNYYGIIKATSSNGINIGGDYTVSGWISILSSGNVGVGESNPASRLTVRKDAAGARGGEISIVNYAASTLNSSAALNFGLEASTYDADNGNAQIKAQITNAANSASDIIMSTWNGSAFGERFRIASAGAATFSSSVTATSFFESSDIRLKSNVQDYIDYDVLNIGAKIYEKDGKIEVGYIAQDVEKIVKSAVAVRDNDMLDLSYRQVHTAKIAALEAKIKQLEEQLKNK